MSAHGETDVAPIHASQTRESELGTAPPKYTGCGYVVRMQVRRLGLTKETLVHSTELRTWCEQHRNRCYIPESLLKSWGIEVDALSMR